MKILYIGGQKSGKSYLAEKKILEISTKKPYYIATYDNSYGDKEMQQRVDKHQKRREANFITVEEPMQLERVIKENENYIVDCLSMWILNSLDADKNYQKILENILSLKTNIVFVLNDVGSGIVPSNRLSRKYIDRSGIVGQIVASSCDEVYQVVVGIENRLK